MADVKVLVVDDEEKIIKGIKALLEEIIGGFQVVLEATNGKKALESLPFIKVDLMITDIRMPEMDGIELIKRVRKQFPDMPILVLSGYDEYEYMRQALRNNVTDYLLKPIDRIEFAETVGRLKLQLEGKKHMDEVKNIQEPEGKKHFIINKVKELVAEKLHQDSSLQSIAEEVNYSYAHLSTLFKSETGQAFSDYLLETRMAKAKQMLKETNLKIYEIGSLCGYPNAKYFMSVFKEAAGITPSEFRYKEQIK